MDKRGNNMSISELKEIQKRVIKKNKIINYIFLIITSIILLPVIIQKIYTLINNNTQYSNFLNIQFEYHHIPPKINNIKRKII